ncbi:MAG: hypothetical protein JSU07_03075 [Bacteroidetes bacterium]|nr:hypothetical protein [Bacteroidota bacterium]
MNIDLLIKDIEGNNRLKEEIFKLFLLQLKKDFDLSGLNSDFILELKNDFNTLKSLMTEQVLKLSTSNNLNKFLYRVDIPESVIREKLKKNNQDLETKIAELIIKRVLQKVILKIKFSNK